MVVITISSVFCRLVKAVFPINLSYPLKSFDERRCFKRAIKPVFIHTPGLCRVIDLAGGEESQFDTTFFSVGVIFFGGNFEGF